MITVPDTNTFLLISPTIQDPSLAINLNVTIQKWCYICHSIITSLRITAISLTSLLQVLQYVALFRYLFRSPNNLPPTYEDANQAPEKTQRSKNKSKSDKVTAVLQPTGGISLKDIMRIKY